MILQSCHWLLLHHFSYRICAAPNSLLLLRQNHVVEILLCQAGISHGSKRKLVTGSNKKSALGVFDKSGNIPIELGLSTL